MDSYTLAHCLRENEKNLQRFALLERYFFVENDILYRQIPDEDKPNNRLAHAFAKYITKIATAYFMGEGVKYMVDNPAYKADLDDILDSNMTDVKHFEEAISMSQLGMSFELIYINEEGKLKTQSYKGDEIIPVFSESKDSFLTMAIRPYEIKDIQSKRITKYADVYTKYEIIRFSKTAGKTWQKIESFPHNFSDVPVIVRQNNSSSNGDYEDVISLIDGYDRAESDSSNDLEYFANAYLAMEGVTDMVGVDENGEELSTEETVQVMKENRFLFFPNGGKGYFVTKPAGDDSAESFKQRLFRDIFFLSMVPNLTDESFAGNLSGVAMAFKLFGLKELSQEKEKYWISSEKKKIRLITEYINKIKNKNYDWRTVDIQVDRSAITNLLETAQVVNYLRDIVSEEGLLRLIPGVDVSEEMERKAAERHSAENDTLEEA